MSIENIPDKETQEILDGMKKDGFFKEEPKAQETKPEVLVEEPKADIPADSQPEKKGEEEKAPETVVEPEPKPEARMVPYSKFKEARDKAHELEQQLKNAKNTPEAQKDTADDIKVLSEKYNLDADAVTELVQTIEKRFPKLDPELAKTIESLKEDAEWKKQQEHFSREFETNVVPLIRKDNPNATEGDILTVKKKLDELAFTDTLATTPLKYIYLGEEGVRLTPKSGRKSAESSKGGSQKGADSIDFDTPLSKEQIAGMTDDEFEKYSDAMAARSKSPLRRGGQIVR